MKKALIFIFTIILFTSLIMAQSYKLEVSTIPEEKFFKPGETITLNIIIRDSNNNPIQDELSLILKDIQEKIIKEITIKSSNPEQIKLPENILAGKGEIIATYKDTKIIETFKILDNKLIDIKIKGEKLILTNIGNTVYDEEINIIIGDTIGTKTPNLNIGESISYRLVAPEGVYNIKVRDNNEILFTKGEVGLSGTGQVIAAIDDSTLGRTGLTGGISPDKDDEEALLNYAKNSKFIYVFMLTIFGAMILLAIERRYKRRTK